MLEEKYYQGFLKHARQLDNNLSASSLRPQKARGEEKDLANFWIELEVEVVDDKAYLKLSLSLSLSPLVGLRSEGGEFKKPKTKETKKIQYGLTSKI